MITMQDVTKTIVKALKDNWQALSSIRKRQIAFVRGEPLSLDMRFAKGVIASIEVKGIVDPISKRSLARSTHKEVVAIDVWLRLDPIIEKHKEKLMDTLQDIKDEIERIVKAKQTSSTDIRFMFPRSWIPLTNLKPENENPYLRSMFYVVCQYEK